MARFGILIAAAMLAVDPWGWDRFGPFRWALISTLGFAAIAISLGSGDARLRPLPRWAVLGWVVTIAGLALSTALSNDLWHALIGTPDRHLGLATWLLFVGLFATASLYPNTAITAVLRAAALSGSLAGLWAILEARGVSPFDSSFANDRVGGPFGQPAFLGASMVLIVPLSVALLVDRGHRWAWRAAGATGSALGLTTLALAESRAAWVGAAVAAVALVLRRRSWIVGFAGVAVVASLLFTTSLGDRAATLTDFDDGVVAGRIDEWQVGIQALTTSPTFGVLGYGPEGYRTVFGEYVDEEYVIEHGRDVITDRAHSGLLDTSLAGGLLAGLGMALLQLGLAVTSVQRLRSDDPSDIALGVAVFAYLVQQLFLFPLAELDPVLWILAGILVARRPQRRVQRPPLFTSVSGGKRSAMLAAGFVAAVSAIAGLSDIAADHAVVDVERIQLEGLESQSAVDAADSARSRRPDSIRYDFIAGRAAQDGSLGGFEQALERLDDGLSISPNDPALLAERGIVLLEIARRSDDSRTLQNALTALEALDETDPNNPATELTHGIALALDGQSEESISELEHAAFLDPGATEPWLNLAVVHFDAGNTVAATHALDRVDELAPSNAQAQALRREFLSE